MGEAAVEDMAGTGLEILASHALALLVLILAGPAGRAAIALLRDFRLVALDACDGGGLELLSRATGFPVGILVWHDIEVVDGCDVLDESSSSLE
jgi:hypothetical protein